MAFNKHNFRDQELREMGIAMHVDGELTGVFAPKVSSRSSFKHAVH